MRGRGIGGLRGEGGEGGEGECGALFRGADYCLQGADDLRLPAVRFRFVGLAEAHEAVVGKIAHLRGGDYRRRLLLMDSSMHGLGAPELAHLRVELLEAISADGSGNAGKAFVDHGLRESDGVEEVRAAIAVDDTDAHLGHDLGETEFEGKDEISSPCSDCRSRAVSRASQGQMAPAPMPSRTAT